MEVITYRSNYYPDKDITIPASEDHRPKPVVLVPELAIYYSVEDDSFHLLCDGVPVGNVVVQAKDYHEECKQLTKDIWAVVRKLADIHRARLNLDS